MVALWGKFSYYPQIIDKEMQTQRARGCNVPQIVSLQAAESGYELSLRAIESGVKIIA